MCLCALLVLGLIAIQCAHMLCNITTPHVLSIISSRFSLEAVTQHHRYFIFMGMHEIRITFPNQTQVDPCKHTAVKSENRVRAHALRSYTQTHTHTHTHI